MNSYYLLSKLLIDVFSVFLCVRIFSWLFKVDCGDRFLPGKLCKLLHDEIKANDKWINK